MVMTTAKLGVFSGICQHISFKLYLFCSIYTRRSIPATPYRPCKPGDGAYRPHLIDHASQVMSHKELVMMTMRATLPSDDARGRTWAGSDSCDSGEDDDVDDNPGHN